MNLKASASAIGNTGEANAAAAAITRLLLEYNLSESDIPDQEKLDNPVISSEIPYRIKSENGRWYKELVGVICQYNLCHSILILNRNMKTGKWQRDKYEIVGRQKNVETVLYLISFLANQFVTIGRRGYPAYRMDCIRKYGRTPLTEHMYLQSFLIGCVIGLDEKLDHERNEVSGNITALVVSTKQEIDDFLKDQKIGKARKDNKMNPDALSAVKGIEVGRNIEINKGIEASVADEHLLS